MLTANKCLEKLKLPTIEASEDTNWNAVQARMEQACAVIERVSARDKQLLGVTGKMKQAFRKLCKNAGAGKIFTSLIPNDMCGSVLSSGLNVVFTALEETGFYRESVAKALERLPRILENHVEYTELASEDAEIHRRTAKLYTEVCLTLDHVLRWYRTHAFVAGAKRLLNPSAYSNGLNERIAEVNLAAKDLKARGTQFMWGRVRDISTTQEWMSYETVKVGRQLNDIDQSVKLLADRSASYESVEKAVLANLPPLLEAVVQRLTIKNTAVVRKIKPVVTVESILEHLLTQLDVDRVRTLQSNPRMRAWLAVDEDSLLFINGRSDALDPSTSFLAAQMVQSLLQQETSPQEAMVIIPLAYFCSQHRNYYRDVAANPAEMVMSILLQLIDHYGEFQSMELRECLDRTDVGNIQSICASFGHLVNRLPANFVIYLIIEGVSYFNTPPERQRGMRDAIQHIVQIYRQRSEATFKVLFVAPTRCRNVEELFEDDEILNAPSNPTPIGGPFLSSMSS
ncbi:hypothetical protein F5Y19DRAFT_462828 [Xylariaceae sp. FL1651]|nr:hypothetical protein F5Y19DRAFT_462828 [Xylariaceae sp. FL1651]